MGSKAQTDVVAEFTVYVKETEPRRTPDRPPATVEAFHLHRKRRLGGASIVDISGQGSGPKSIL